MSIMIYMLVIVNIAARDEKQMIAEIVTLLVIL